MISREVLEAQLVLYQEAQKRAMGELEGAKANLAACGGAIETCQNLLRLVDQMEEAQAAEADAKKKRKKK